ncbi:MAG TPA: hypothetical protein VE737_06480, partial [Actinomycetota bacterium]|nr:hypothetical protein [Actinomycetota bacterium]
MDLTGAIRRHPARTAAVLAAGAVVVVAGFLWFRPDRLFTDDPVNEAAPGVVPGEMDTGMNPAGGSGPGVLARGRFISL